MSWVRMNMRYAGKCVVCNKTIRTGEVGLWMRGKGVKHEECGEQTRIPCVVCGKPAGCNQCEMADGCDIKKVSPLCICAACDSGNAIESYKAAVARKFPALASGSGR